MIDIRDEIILALAGILEMLPPPAIPTFDKENEEQEKEEIKEVDEKKDDQPLKPLPLPMPLPVSYKQEMPAEPKPAEVTPAVSHNAWQEAEMGTAEWVAKNHPYSYLFGHKPFLKFTGDKKFDPITKSLMEYIVTKEPEKYFEWGLHRKKLDLDRLGVNWGREAAKALVEKDPYYAMVLGIYDNDYDIQKDPEILPRLWQNMMDSEFKRSSEMPEANIFPGVLFSRMRGLLSVLEKQHPDFYDLYLQDNALAQRIKSGRKFKTKETTRQLSKRDFPWGEPEPGTPEWLAEKYPHTYLRGQDTLSKGYVRELQDPFVIGSVMNRLVEENPIKYFEWNLRRVGDKGGRINLKEWLLPATKALIKKDPYSALMFARVYQYRENESLLPELWQRLADLEGDSPSGQEVFRQMRSLAGKLAVTHPDFYMRNIQNTVYATAEFNDRARQMLSK